MADDVGQEISQTLEGNSEQEAAVGTGSLKDMDLETEAHSSESHDIENQPDCGQKPEENGKEESMDVSTPAAKRAREEEENGKEGDNAISKKLKVEKSAEEKRLEELEEKEDEGEVIKHEEEKVEVKEGKTGGKESPAAVNLGPKIFRSSVEMFDYFFKLLHFWQPNIDINKYEYMVLLELLKKGHIEPDKKLGEGVNAFQVRYHPMWKSRCFFLVREDGFADDFSFRKCVDKILPLPDNMKVSANKDEGKKTGVQHKGGRGGRGRGGRGRGKKGGSRN